MRWAMAVWCLIPTVGVCQQTRGVTGATGVVMVAPDLVMFRDTLPGLLGEGHNPAGAHVLGQTSPMLAVGVHRTTGALRRPQEAARPGRAGVLADGGGPIGAWWLGGSFGYTRASDQGQRWSSVADAYGGSPYVWADSIGGDWLRDHVSVTGTIASPEWAGRITSGLSLNYEIGQGARRNDPRPLYRLRRLGVLPGVRVRAGGVLIGATISAAFEREEGEIGQFSNTDPVVFRLRGLGTFDRTALRTADRIRIGRSLSAGAQLAGGSDHRVWGAAVEYGVGRDSAFDGVATPVDAGRFRLEWTAARARTRRGRFDVELRAHTRTGRGTDPVFGAVNVIDRDDSLSAVARHWRGSGPDAAHWLVALSGGVDRRSRQDVAAATDWSATAARAALGATIRPHLAGRRWLFMGRFGIRRILDRTYQAARPTTLTPVLVEPDFAVHTFNRLEWMVGTGIPLSIRDGHRLWFFAAWRRQSADDISSRRRDDLTATLLMQ